MLRFLLLFAAAAIVGCSSSGRYDLNKLSQEVDEKLYELKGKEKERLERVAKAIFPAEWKVIGVFGVEGGEEGFKKYLVAVYSPYQHAVYYRFIWITEDGRYLTTALYRLGENKVSLIVPAKEKEHPLESLRWILDFERIAMAHNLPVVLTPGERTLYLVWNPYCESCFKRWKEILKTAEEKRISIKLIPYHGTYYPWDNLYLLIYVLNEASAVGLFEVLNRYYSAESFDEFMQRLKNDAFAAVGKIPKERFNEIGAALKSINKVLTQAKILVVPTTVRVVSVDPTAGLASGYVFVGEIKLD